MTPRTIENLFVVLVVALTPFSVQALEAKQYLDFKIVIPTVLFFRSATAPQSVEISDEDLSRGYVDVSVEYVVTSNSRKGFTFGATLTNVQQFVSFQSLYHDTEISMRFSLLLNAIGAPNKQLPVTIVYRFWINHSEISSRTYPWPVVVTLIQN